MHRNHVLTLVTISGLSLILVAGCGTASNEPEGVAGNAGSSTPALPPDTADLGHDDHGHAGHDHGDHGHGHPSEGPHHGHLIELGGEEYHAEFVHDTEHDTVSIYILDSAAKNSVPIEATEITINLKHDGKGEQFKLAASPDKDDPEGKSSRFVSNDEDLVNDLHDEDSEAHLVLQVGGKSFRGKIPHDHDHGHDHKGHDHDKEKKHEGNHKD